MISDLGWILSKENAMSVYVSFKDDAANIINGFLASSPLLLLQAKHITNVIQIVITV